MVTVTLLVTLARPTGAQHVRGTVLEAASGPPIYMADVALVASDETVAARGLTDEKGRFVLGVTKAGVYRLRVTRMGYMSFTTDAFVLGPEQDVVRDLRLVPSPIPLDPIEAVAEKHVSPRLARIGFYRRQTRGIGHFLTPEDLKALRPVVPADLFSGMGGVRVAPNATVVTLSFHRPCVLSVAIDGFVVQYGGQVDTLGTATWTDLLHVSDIEAMEVYPHPAGVPVWMSGSVSPCGAIVIWTKGSLR